MNKVVRTLEEMVKVDDCYSRFTTEYDMEFTTKHFRLEKLIPEGEMETVNDLGFACVILCNGETYYEFETCYHESEETGELLLDEVILYQGEEYPLFDTPTNTINTVDIPIYYKNNYYLLILDVEKVLELDKHLVMHKPNKNI